MSASPFGPPDAIAATLAWWARTMPRRYARYVADGAPSEQAARAALDEAIRRADQRIGRLAAQLRLGELSVDEWEGLLRIEVVRLHTAATALARGGVGKLTMADLQELEA